MERREFDLKPLADNRHWCEIRVGAIKSVSAVHLVDMHGVVGPVELSEADWLLDGSVLMGELPLEAVGSNRRVTVRLEHAHAGRRVYVDGEWSDDGISDAG